MKKLMISLLAVGALLITSSTGLKANDENNEPEKVCFYQLNEEGECEWVCVNADDAIVMPCFDCPPSCWD